MGTYTLRVPASRVGYVLEAQGGFSLGPHVQYVLATRTGLGRWVRTAYCGNPGRHHFDEDAEARWRSLVGGGGLGGAAGAGAAYGLPKTARPPTPPRPRAAHGSRSHLRPVSAHGARTDSRAARAARMHGGEGRGSGGGGAPSSGWKEVTDPRHSTPTHWYNKEARAISHARPESAPPRPPRPSSTRRGTNSGAAQERGGGGGGGGGGYRWASAARGRDTVGFYDDAKRLEV